jgi:hypothetical protein
MIVGIAFDGLGKILNGLFPLLRLESIVTLGLKFSSFIEI